MPLRTPRILVLDDEPAIRLNLAAFLTDDGYDVHEAESAEAALVLLQRYSFDLALVDVRLPHMEGDAFMLQAHHLQPELRFLVHTGSLGFGINPELAAIGLGHDDIFCKPLADMAVLSRAINHHLRVGRRLF
jgi:DNA-binding response OmpR family regulator